MPKAQPSFCYGIFICLLSYFKWRYFFNKSIYCYRALDILESDVIKSWRYWQTQGIVELLEDYTVHFCQ